MRPQQHTFHPAAGIAIGPILFVIAILAVLAAVMSAGMGSFGSASITDRVAADIQSQANLIRTKINECNMLYGTNANYDGYPSSGGVAIAVSTIACTGDPSGLQNIWTGARATALPPPTSGFDNWYYINTNTTGLGGTASGGRCIYALPSGSNPANNTGLVNGLTKAAGKFTSATSNDGASEVNYNPASSTQRFVMWITLPTGTAVNSCNPDD